MNKKMENLTAILLGGLMIIFGLNKFFGFIAIEPPPDPVAQQFLGAMFSSYLYVVVALAEIIGGILLVIPRFRLLGWLIQGVIIFNIVAFHLAHDFIGNGIWLVPTILFIIVGFFQLSNMNGLFGRTTAVLLLVCWGGNVSAQSGNYLSLKVENHIVIDEPAEKIWTFISQVEQLSILVPEVIKKVESNGEGLYTSWLIHLQNDLFVQEKMTYFNPEEMEFSYVMTKTPMPLSDNLAIQKVQKINKNKSRVTFTTYYNTSSQNKAQLQATFNDFQNTYLNNIKKNLR